MDGEKFIQFRFLFRTATDPQRRTFFALQRPGEKMILLSPKRMCRGSALGCAPLALVFSGPRRLLISRNIAVSASHICL